MKGMVSVIIPCRNEVKAIEGTVRAILASDHQNLEVLVVDGMSEDGTRAVLQALSQEDVRVRCIDNVKKLTPYAFNLGVQNAKGEFVQIVGSRNVMAKNYLSLLIEALQMHPEVACVGGDYQHVHDSPSGRFISLSMESPFGMGIGNYRTQNSDTYVDTVGVPMYRRSLFATIGYFDESLTRNQDDEFNFRVTQAGYKILYVHTAKVTYLVRGSLQKAFRQFAQYGYFKVFVNKKHKNVTTLRQLVPAVFLAFWVLSVPLLLWAAWWIYVVAAVAVAYVLLGIVAAGQQLSLFERLRVLFTCFVLHVGYGWGYWQGIFDFLLLQRRPRLTFQQQTT